MTGGERPCVAERRRPRDGGRGTTALGRDRVLRLVWLSLYAAGMAYVEAAVVAYLRLIGYGGGFDASTPDALGVLPRTVVLTEVGREAATIVMLAAVALLAARRSWWERLGCFLWAFAVWDVLYYVWLRLLTGWPQSMMTLDVLFLIPFVWVAPVVFPLAVSGIMMALALAVLRRS